MKNLYLEYTSFFQLTESSLQAYLKRKEELVEYKELLRSLEGTAAPAPTPSIPP